MMLIQVAKRNFRNGGANLPVCRDDPQVVAHHFGNFFWQSLSSLVLRPILVQAGLICCVMIGRNTTSPSGRAERLKPLLQSDDGPAHRRGKACCKKKGTGSGPFRAQSSLDYGLATLMNRLPLTGMVICVGLAEPAGDQTVLVPNKAGADSKCPPVGAHETFNVLPVRVTDMVGPATTPGGWNALMAAGLLAVSLMSV